jgi:methylenetetrahydrofolate reductase (NADPH)
MLPDLRITDLLETGRPLKSVEFFPAKDEAGLSQLRATAREIRKLSPDFVSITYGAGGTTRERTASIARLLREDYGFITMAHLTCVNHTADEVLAIAREHHAAGIRNIMALRGDVPKGLTREEAFKDGLRSGSDIVALLKKHLPDICLGVGGYPEKHPESPSVASDIDALRRKVDAGADFITTQLFFDNSVYYLFEERCRRAGIRIPIIPGIMPVLSLKQIRRFTELCGSTLPAALVARLEACGDDAAAMEQVGAEWAARQCRDLLNNGAPGFHLYILNRAPAALSLIRALRI